MLTSQNLDQSVRFRNIFYKFLVNLGRVFSGSNLIWHALAIVLTYVLATSGWDWGFYRFFRNTILYPISFSAAAIGGILPIIAPLAVYFTGRVKKNLRLINTGQALVQAGLLGSMISSAYKALTGRSHPPEGLLNLSIDPTRAFNFSFFQNGVFWGWPSSHTTIAFATAITLAVLYSSNKKIVYFSWAYAFYIGLFVAISIHWFSDFVAGAIIGTVIGVVVGRSFRVRLNLLIHT